MNDLVSLISRLPTDVLPAGTVVSPEDGESPVYWLSDEAAPPGRWSRFRAGHTEWRLRPLLLRGDDGHRQSEYPWQAGEVFPANMTAADQHDIADEMQYRRRDYTRWEDTDDELLSEAERIALTAPFGRDWPGLGPAIALQGG